MKVYLDNAATTPLAPEVFEVMAPLLKNEFGNPSSTHFFGRQAKAILETSRRTVAALIHAQPSEIIFTSGGTEADNMALNCAIHDLGVERIITSSIEHHAVIHTAEHICNRSTIQLDLVQFDEFGHVDLTHLHDLLSNSTKKTLVSLMHGNNEIGNLLPLDKVSGLCREFGAYFHSDTVQTMGHYAFNMQDLDIDFLTCAAHKFHGPKGVGFLYVNKKIKLQPMILGGSQERGMRGGTENLYGIAGLAKALEIANADIPGHHAHVQGLKSYMMEQLKLKLEDVCFHGDTRPERGLYTVLNVSLPATPKAAMLLFTLDLKGVACSGGSACSSGSNKGSHVLEGIQADTTRPNARFSFSRYTTRAEIDYAVNVLVEVYASALV
jgi:cysteine desulfurase